jgi:hypothetical protein
MAMAHIGSPSPNKSGRQFLAIKIKLAPDFWGAGGNRGHSFVLFVLLTRLIASELAG